MKLGVFPARSRKDRGMVQLDGRMGVGTMMGGDEQDSDGEGRRFWKRKDTMLYKLVGENKAQLLRAERM